MTQQLNWGASNAVRSERVATFKLCKFDLINFAAIRRHLAKLARPSLSMLSHGQGHVI
ncbi:hypothetical protein IGS59_21750 [Janthinobacterium sp. GW460P]|uniref:hypothetical protein n=1 Tax=unclassified Janthinobacterium TaxID=2610881 RepID=UPI001483C0E8|nr:MULTISPECIES: hypothetical protein [unclassified Janthinobacterium]MCC7704871.1 hypothetical protein [Janthinobacterium sp. GW460P]MCC7710514.1 hypothetical protein [Janthinobacterium sp. GW460W]